MDELGKSPQVTGPKTKRASGRARMAAKAAAASASAPAGPVELEVRQFIAKQGELGDELRVLAATGISLGRILDVGAGMSAAAISKELRAICAELSQAAADDHFAYFSRPLGEREGRVNPPPLSEELKPEREPKPRPELKPPGKW